MDERDHMNLEGGENAAAQGITKKLYPDLPERVAGYDPKRIADTVFWLAHGDEGRPLMRLPVLEYALAAGLLAELALDEKIGLYDGSGSGHADHVAISFTPTPERPCYDYEDEAPADATSRYVYDQIGADQTQDLGTWLEAIATISLEQVRQRLKLGTMPRRTGLFGQRGRRLPRAPTGREAVRAWAALGMRIHRRADLSTADAFLIAISRATGTQRTLLESAPPSALRHAEAAVEDLPDLLAQIVAATEISAARSAIRPR